MLPFFLVKMARDKEILRKVSIPKNSLLADERFQDEWDFCYLEPLGTNTLKLALIYEYTRQSPWIVDALSRWLDFRFPEPREEAHESNDAIVFPPKRFIGKK